MKQEITYADKDDNSLAYINPNIKICIVCGYEKIESYEHGVSCEECGTLFGRSK